MKKAKKVGKAMKGKTSPIAEGKRGGKKAVKKD